jgi:hypothetical protein
MQQLQRQDDAFLIIGIREKLPVIAIFEVISTRIITHGTPPNETM